MPRPLPVDYLQPDEAPVTEAGRHGGSVIDEVLRIVLLSAVAITGVLVWTLGFQPRFFLPVAVPVMSLVTLAAVALLVSAWWRVTTSHYVITDARVYKAYGRLRFSLLQTTYDKVTDLHVRQSLWGRIGDFGTVRVETAGTGVVFEGVRSPFQFKQQVEAARADFIEALVGAHAPAAKQAKDNVQAGEALPLWTGKPTVASMVGGLIAAGVTMAVGAVMLIAAPLAGPPMFWVGIGAGLLGIIAIAQVIIRRRFTDYVVQERGVVVTSGWLSRRRVETRYAKVTDVMVYQGILGRILGFGNITINTAGSNVAPVVFHGLGEPEQVKAIIDEARREA